MLVLVLVVVLPTSPRRLELREATSGRLSSKWKAGSPDGLEGSRFGMYLGDPAIFRFGAPSGQRMSQRAAPANNPSALHYRWF
jgi:hypothetical protein